MNNATGYVVRRYPATPVSATRVREHVAATVEGWGKPQLVEDAVLCAVELATNAILHTREPYDFAMRPAGDGVRIEVIDGRPLEVPRVVPVSGTAADITGSATTGRGLRIIGALATRWGVTVTGSAKSVWAEVAPHAPAGTVDPLMIVDRAEAPPGPLLIRLVSVPVRPAVMSGVQVDELVRELQLRRPEGPLSATERTGLDDLLDRSAHPRLSGRYAALQAAGRGQMRFDLHVHSTPEAMDAMNGLGSFLAELASRLPMAAAIPPAVQRFRGWLSEEVARQVEGLAPRDCSLPS